MKVIGIVECKDCNYKKINPELNCNCPNCSSDFLFHKISNKIILCPRNNPLGFSKKILSHSHKEIILNKKGRNELYKLIIKFLKDNNKLVFTSSDIMNKFEVLKFTNGDLIRDILHLCICEGNLEKSFKKDKRSGHKYFIQSSEICPYLSKEEGIYFCNYDFEESKKLINSSDIF